MADLVPYTGPISTSRNANPISLEAEAVLHRFLNSGQDVAAVENYGADIDRFYKSLWNLCQKDPYLGQIKTSRIDGAIILIKLHERK